MKKPLRILLITILISLIALIVLVITVDPFYHYHAPAREEDTYLYTSFYQSPGVARHFSYDAAIVGTSLTENNRASWYDEAGYKAVKLSYSGARTADYSMLLDQVYNSGNDIRLIVMDLNEYQLTLDPTDRISTDPDYLTDNNVLTDVKYIFNKDVITASLGRLLARATGTSGNIDEAYTWDGEELFSADNVLYDYDMSMAGIDRAYSVAQTDEDLSEKLETVDANMANIIPYIEAHPETTFQIYYPPYSMGYWESLRDLGDLHSAIEIYKRAAQDLAVYDNVSFYMFFDMYDEIVELDDYRDISHYRPEINRRIYDEMMSSPGQDISDIIERLDRLEEYVNATHIVDEYR